MYPYHRILYVCQFIFLTLRLASQSWHHNLEPELPGTAEDATYNFALQGFANSVLIKNKDQEVRWLNTHDSVFITGSLFFSPLFSSYKIESASVNTHDSTIYFSAEYRSDKSRLYSSSYRNQRWSTPKAMDFSSELSDDHHPYYDSETQYLYFASRRTGGLGGLDIWYTQCIAGKWSTPKNLGAGVNTPMNEMQPTICKSDLIFSSDQDVQNAGFDLRLAHAKGGFSSSISMSENINSSRNDLRMIQTQDDRFIVMRSGHKQSDNFEWVTYTLDNMVSQLTYRVWRHHQPAIQTSLFIGFSGTAARVYTSDINGILNLSDLPGGKRLEIKLIQNSEPCEFQILDKEGMILLSLTLKPGETIELEPLDLLYASAERWYPEDESRLNITLSELATPSGFSIHRNSNGEPIAIIAQTFPTSEQNQEWLINTNEKCAVELPLIKNNLPLMDVEKTLASKNHAYLPSQNDAWRIDRIYFDYSTDELDEFGKAQCKIILELMLLNPDLIIELTGGTDLDGTQEFNWQLGIQRAQKVRQELLQYGIASSRIRTYSRGKNCGCQEAKTEIQEKIAPLLRRVDVKYLQPSGH